MFLIIGRMLCIVRVAGRSLMTAFTIFTHVDSRVLLSLSPEHTVAFAAKNFGAEELPSC